MKTQIQNQNQTESGLQSRPELEGKGEGRLSQHDTNRKLNTEQVLGALKRWMPSQFELAQVVGQWIWIRFEAKPEESVRRELFDFGFHWNAKRQAWQHPCGKESKGSSADPIAKYGVSIAASKPVGE